jgi:hypothetical protein
MIATFGARTLQIAIPSERVHERMAIHAVAMAGAMLVAARLGTGGVPSTYIAWYCVLFVGFQLVLVPALAARRNARRRFDDWVRLQVEQEMIRLDLQSYDRQLKRLLAIAKEARGDGDRYHE